MEGLPGLQRHESFQTPGQQDASYIFDDLQKLQYQCKMENELQKMFSRIFEEQILKQSTELNKQFLTRQLRYRSDHEFFKYQVEDENYDSEITKVLKGMEEATKQEEKQMLCHQLDQLQINRGNLQKPKVRIIDQNPEQQFTADGKRVIESLFWYLWDNKDIQNLFIEDYFLKNCDLFLKQREIVKVNELIELVVHDLFSEQTAQFPDWRVVEIQQKLIESEVKKAQTLSDIQSNQFLIAWFEQLTKQNEAQRCIHYMFRQKLEKIDYNYLTWHNMQKIYQRYQQNEQGSFVTSRGSIDSTSLQSSDRDSFNSSMRDRSSVVTSRDSVAIEEASKNEKKSMLQEQYKMLFNSMIEIVDVISEQIFEKVQTLPYAVRQFCKCLYQALKDKFGKPSTDFDIKIIRVVSSFLLERWILNSIFVNLNMEGLVKDFILSKNCILNLQLMQTILIKTMTMEEWEVATPQSEKVPGDTNRDLFVMPPDLQQIKRQKSKTFYRDLLQLDKESNSLNGLKQDLETVSEGQNKLGWRVMCLSMRQIHLLVQFFTKHIKDKQKGVSNLIDKIEFYDEDSKILTEKARQDIDLNLYLTECAEFGGHQIGQPTLCYLFMKQPQQPKVRVDVDPLVNKATSEIEKRVRKHLKAILMESDNMGQYKPFVKDKNSISSILSLLRLQIEKKKVFGESNGQDFKYNFVINSIKAHFDVYKNQAREQFSKFIKIQRQDQKQYNQQLQESMIEHLGILKTQENLLDERIKVTNILIQIVSLLRKNRSRSLFMINKKLVLKIYQFAPNDHLELVEADQKSLWSREYQEHIENEKVRKQKEEDRKKSSAILEERLKQPLQGNLALNFLFKDQDISEIIKMNGIPPGNQTVNRQTEQQAMRDSVSSFNQMIDEEVKEIKDITKIPGYYRKKHSHEIGNTNDFIHKMRKTSVLQKFFSRNDSNFGGIKELFKQLYSKMEQYILEDKIMRKDLKLHLEEIHEYIMFQLHQEFFYNQTPSEDEIRFQHQVTLMYDLEPAAYGIPASINANSPEMKFAWKIAIRQLFKIQEAQTPRTKLLQIGKCIEIIQHSFDLTQGEQVTADDLVMILPYLFVKAKIDRLLAQFNFIEAFHRGESDGDKVEVYLTNFRIVIERIQKFKLPDPESSNLHPQDGFEMKIETN